MENKITVRAPSANSRLWRVRTVLIGLVVSVLAPVVFLVTAYSIWNLRLHHEVVDRGLADSARVLSLAVDRDIEALQTLLGTLSRSPTLRAGNLAPFHAYAGEVAKRYNGWIVLTDPSLQQVFNTLRPFGTPLPKTSVPDLLARLFATGRSEVSDLFFGKVAQKWVLAVLVPVLEDGRVAYIIDMTFEPARLSTLLIESREQPTPWEAFVLDRNYRIIASTRKDGGDIGTSVPAWFATEIAGKTAGVISDKPFNDQRMQIAFERSRTSGWTTVVFVPTEILSAPTRQAAWILAAGIFVSLGLACLAAILIGRRIASPIQALARGASQLVSGEKVRFPCPPVLEVADVKQSLLLAAELRRAESEMRFRLQEERRAREAVELANSRYRALTDAIASIVYVTPPDGQVIDMPQWRALTGQGPEEVRGWGWIDALHPDDRKRTYDALVGAIGGKRSFDIEYRVRDKTGRYLWFNDRGVPILDDDGRVREWVGVCIDINERRLATERQELLMAELDHRVRNILATIQSMVTLTSVGTTSKDEYTALLRGRVAAMARTHGLLSLHTWDGATLAEIVRNEIGTLAGAGNQVVIEGDREHVLKPKDAADFALVVHELTTNAAKYGALSVATGRIEVSWRMVGEPPRELCFDWRESGGPPVTPPRRRGFGSRLIEAVFANTVGRSACFEFAISGFSCRLTMPLKGMGLKEDEEEDAAEATEGGDNGASTGNRPRLLVVEDEPLVALDLQTVLDKEGFVVIGPTGDLEEALSLVDTMTLDGAILDINLGEAMVFPVVEKLLARHVPIVFVTGYEANTVLPERFRTVPTLNKPIDHGELLRTLRAVLAPSSAAQRSRTGEGKRVAGGVGPSA